jgi:hypothetical protein
VVGAAIAPEENAADVCAVETVGEPPLGVTVKVYDVPFVSPVQALVFTVPTVIVPLMAAQEPSAGESVTTYEVATPSAANETIALPLPFGATVGATRGVPSVTATVAGATSSTLVNRVKPDPGFTPAAGFVTPAITSVVAPETGVQPVPLIVTVTT